MQYDGQIRNNETNISPSSKNLSHHIAFHNTDDDSASICSPFFSSFLLIMALGL